MKQLLLDMHYLCYRALHTTGGVMAHKGMLTGVLYGVLRDIDNLRSDFNADACVFCFDSKHSRRRELYPAYKAHRAGPNEETSEEELFIINEFRRQIVGLRREVLPAIGFENILVERGFEADDLIAAQAEDAGSGDECIIISADHDLYQCLRQNVWLYDPKSKQSMTFDKFRAEWGILPSQWAQVKAMAGCASDNVKGIRGIGEKTAAKWVRGTLKAGGKQQQSCDNALDIITRNMQLVKLPMEGCTAYEIVPDRIKRSAWNDVVGQLGMTSLGKDTRGKKTKTSKSGRKRIRYRPST